MKNTKMLKPISTQFITGKVLDGMVSFIGNIGSV